MFDVPAEAYAEFMGRYSEPLAVQFATWVGLRAGQRALDVGCGPGALTSELVSRLGDGAVSAIDPSESFVAAIGARFPGVDARTGVAEELPFPDHSFDAALAQLVVHFMSDPVSGLSEMARVTRRGGVVAACVWDHAGAGGPLFTFWRAVRDLHSNATDESSLPGVREGQLAQLCLAAGLKEIDSSSITVEVPFATFEDWWAPFTRGVGPAGSFVAGLDTRQREFLRRRCAELLPPIPFVIPATAWTVKALA